ncbi:hypothetical protein OG204_01445 [Streptomyces sp. NBC_01387]|uniref:hypothetical protein n=1 Tax=unclassified Streptomyces TaxID=2593676 RepID=UPI0020251AAA|nr:MULTISPECIES: hypothetical protein [unclassified Streptomyces]MCX4553038.1 hypothetical protein [Streptomyces sp. NBC_01500]WSC24360.1 hypothetical protein OIE60_34360 [Streptomyces sp. NBC_01766]WSV58245.1 hypothetical protein OG282_33675 [Streptomyces sp. NBC_01014]
MIVFDVGVGVDGALGYLIETVGERKVEGVFALRHDRPDRGGRRLDQATKTVHMLDL